MIEATTQTEIRDAIQKGHTARAKAAGEIWGWLFGRNHR